ncbi:MAG: hypothetical protein IH586_19035, partial [Anaerolineaceae bacterium]|nr:hypothetical protein [Anaerolineaceae bacterium]
MKNIDISSIAVLVDPLQDNVAVAKQTISPGTQVVGLDGKTLVIRAEVLPGHRFAIRPIADGEWLLQYGQPFAISRGLQP